MNDQPNDMMPQNPWDEFAPAEQPQPADAAPQVQPTEQPQPVAQPEAQPQPAQAAQPTAQIPPAEPAVAATQAQPTAAQGWQPQGQMPYAPYEAPRKKRTGVFVAVGILVVLLVGAVAALGVLVVPKLLGTDETPRVEEITDDKQRDEAPDLSEDATTNSPDGASEDALRADATDILDGLANADAASLSLIGDIVSEGFENQMDLTLESCGVNPIDYASTMLEGFTYEIDSVYTGEDEDTALVTATIDCRDVFSLIDNFNTMLDAYVSSDAYQTSSVEEDMERVGYMFMESARTADMWGGYPLTLEFTRSGDSWELDEDAWEEELDYLFDVE